MGDIQYSMAKEKLSGSGSYLRWPGLAVLLALCLPSILKAQTAEQTPLPPCTNEVRLPMLPLKDPRPLQGANAEEQFQTAPQGKEKNPTASFIDSLKGNDAGIEVILGQGRLLTLKSDIANKGQSGVVAVGDPSVLEFEILPNPRLIRLIGRRPGITDLSITTVDGQTYSFEVHVIYDLEIIRAHLLQYFPDTYLRLGQLRENLVVEGQARNPEQVTQIIKILEDYVASFNPKREENSETGYPGNPARPPAPNANPTPSDLPEAPLPPQADPEARGKSNEKVTYVKPEVINLIRVPGVHQVQLKVQVAELNRTALREIGADLLATPQGNVIGTNIAGSGVTADGILGLTGKAVSPTTTAFGIFPSADFAIFIRALRRNQLMSLMAEPNLIALSGQKASFLAGGQFPVPVTQASGGLVSSVTIVWKDFGVLLNFIPTVLEDETIRLAVAPEVSLLDETIGTRLVPGGTITPGLNTRRADTTVELRQGQTLAIAGLLTTQLDASTDRIPLLGDLPYIGPLFSNNSNRRIEKELLVMVTPFLITPMNCDQVPALPGSDIKDPTDCEFYLKNHLVGRTETSYRSTANWNDPLGMVRRMKVEKRCISGPVGYSEQE